MTILTDRPARTAPARRVKRPPLTMVDATQATHEIRCMQALGWPPALLSDLIGCKQEAVDLLAARKLRTIPEGLAIVIGRVAACLDGGWFVGAAYADWKGWPVIAARFRTHAPGLGLLGPDTALARSCRRRGWLTFTAYESLAYDQDDTEDDAGADRDDTDADQVVGVPDAVVAVPDAQATERSARSKDWELEAKLRLDILRHVLAGWTSQQISVVIDKQPRQIVRIRASSGLVVRWSHSTDSCVITEEAQPRAQAIREALAQRGQPGGPTDLAIAQKLGVMGTKGADVGRPDLKQERKAAVRLEALRLSLEGKSAAEIVKLIDMVERTVCRIREAAGLVMVYDDAKKVSVVAPHAQQRAQEIRELLALHDRPEASLPWRKPTNGEPGPLTALEINYRLGLLATPAAAKTREPLAEEASEPAPAVAVAE